MQPAHDPKRARQTVWYRGAGHWEEFLKLYSHLKHATYMSLCIIACSISQLAQDGCLQTALAMDARREEHIIAAVDASVPFAARSLRLAHFVHTFIHTARLAGNQPKIGPR